MQSTQVPKPPSTITVTTVREMLTGKVSIVVTWLGHSSFEIRSGAKVIYIDPYVGEYDKKADLVLVTHSHSNHCNTSMIDKIRRDDS